MEEKQNPAGQNKPKKKKTGLIVFLIVLAFLVVAGGSGVGGYYLYRYFNPMVVEKETLPPDVVTPQLNDEPEETDTTEATTTAETKTESDVEWLTPPKEITSQNLFKEEYGENRETTAKYYKIGTFIDGKYEGDDLILVSASYMGPSFYPGYYRLVKSKNELVLLEKYSDDVYEGDGLDPAKYSSDNTYDIPELDYPQKINGPKDRQVLLADAGVNAFFSLDGLKKVFTDDEYGDVYTTDGQPEEFQDIFSRHGFYLKAPDGTVRVYALNVDFVGTDLIPNLNWDNGYSTDQQYVYTDTTGCGSSNYLAVTLMTIEDNLEVAGENSQGDAIYEFKDENSYLLKNMYDNEYQIYDEGASKVSYEDFIANHPMFFWVDPFGRLARFKSNQFIPLAECGKPVIYLYPEKTANISVKVEPAGGISYSDPEYNSGWEVTAAPSGELKEISSGRNYPYLFWEGRGAIYEQPKNGFVIKQAEVHQFLLEKLAKLGLNNQESADFMEFWEPRMQNSPYYFVSFLGNREMNKLAPLTINPKPDTVIRILMDFTPLEQPIEVNSYEIKTPERNGFTVVEWGGVIR